MLVLMANGECRCGVLPFPVSPGAGSSPLLLTTRVLPCAWKVSDVEGELGFLGPLSIPCIALATFSFVKKAKKLEIAVKYAAPAVFIQKFLAGASTPVRNEQREPTRAPLPTLP